MREKVSGREGVLITFQKKKFNRSAAATRHPEFVFAPIRILRLYFRSPFSVPLFKYSAEVSWIFLIFDTLRTGTTRGGGKSVDLLILASLTSVLKTLQIFFHNTTLRIHYSAMMVDFESSRGGRHNSKCIKITLSTPLTTWIIFKPSR